MTTENLRSMCFFLLCEKDNGDIQKNGGRFIVSKKKDHNHTKKTAGIRKILLYPLMWVYRLIVGIRNFLFDKGILPSEKFNVPVIAIGNITVGGTGKTPLTEYLIQQLKDKYKIGVLSRGYKRKTHGFVLADIRSNYHEIGDEPCQIKRKYPEIMVAVDANRRNGIRQMLADKTYKPELILLDDAFQHRYVEPDITILPVDYHRLITEDKLLPVGRLREPAKAKKRAQIVIITKCPKELTPIEARIITKKMNLFPYQTLYFTTIAYDELIPVFPEKIEEARHLNKLKEEKCAVLSLSGIASPLPFERYLRRKSNSVVFIRFPDHHDFGKKDISRIEDEYNAISDPNKIIITTEKDAIRLSGNDRFPDSLKKQIYYLPLSIHFLQNREDAFNAQISKMLKKL